MQLGKMGTVNQQIVKLQKEKTGKTQMHQLNLQVIHSFHNSH